MNNLTKVFLFTALSGTLLYGTFRTMQTMQQNEKDTRRKLSEKTKLRRQLLRSQTAH